MFRCKYCGNQTVSEPADQTPPLDFCDHSGEVECAPFDTEELIESYCNQLCDAIKRHTQYSNMYKFSMQFKDKRLHEFHLNRALKYIRMVSDMHDWLDF